MGSVGGKQKRKGEVLTCSVCMNVFQVPRMLPCQHTFCEECLQNYISTTMRHEESKSTFPCPVCRDINTPPQKDKPRDKWARQFPKNRLILSLLETEPQRPELCKDHPGKTIEFYCDSHMQIGCSTCLLTMHKNCDLCSIDDHVEGTKFKANCERINDHLLQYRKLFENMVLSVDRNMDSLENEKEALLKSVKESKQKINEILDSLETKFVQSLDEDCQREQWALHEQSDRCRKVIHEINNTLEQMKTVQAEINKVQKAETVILVEDKMKDFGSLVKDEYSTLETINMDLTLNSSIETLLNSLSDFATVNVNRNKPNMNFPAFVPRSLFQPAPVAVKKRRNKTVSKVGEYPVGSESDTFYCNITSTVVLPDGRILLADDSNCKVKLVDGRFKLKAELKLGSNPLNLALVSEKEVAVSLPGKREILFLEISEKSLTIKRSIDTMLDCWGLDIIDNTIIMTTGRDGHSVILLDMEGKEQKTFLLTSYADENIRCPVAVTAEKKKQLMYITCTGGAWSKGCVILMDMSGKLLHTYYDPDLDTPRGCSIDRNGKVYICGLESSTVYQVTRGGDMYRIFPSKHVETTGPLNMNFIKNYHVRFLLTEVANDKIKVFELPN